MANVTNKSNPSIYRKSVDTAKFDPAEWVIHDTIAKIQSVESIVRRYRKVVGNDVVEMTQAEKDAVDQAITDAQNEAEENGKDVTKIDDRRIINAFKVVLDEINLLRAEHSLNARTLNQFVNAIKNKG